MGKTAFLFPGQGSQYVGMAGDLFASHTEARELIRSADQALEFPLSEAMFGSGDPDGDAARLRRTEITQPALYVHSMALMAVLASRDITFDMAAGHSLGEYSALAASDAISFEEGLRVVQLRGRLMSEAGERRPGAMAAVIGMDDSALEVACRNLSTQQAVVQPANFNSPGQVVISGDAEAVARAVEALPALGARKVIPLPVSGAFHSPLMEYARSGLAEALSKLPIRRPDVPVYLNVTASPSQDPEEIREGLLQQLLEPVRWSQTLRQMGDGGADRFVEVGAGRVLGGLVKRTLGREAHTLAIGTAEDITAFTGQTESPETP